MCKYCEKMSNPISFPMYYTLEDDSKEYRQIGFLIDNNKIKIFEEWNGEKDKKDILFEREIEYCPFCGTKLKRRN